MYFLNMYLNVQLITHIIYNMYPKSRFRVHVGFNMGIFFHLRYTLFNDCLIQLF